MNDKLDKITEIRTILFDIIDNEYPEMPKDVVENILGIQFENTDNSVTASNLVASYLEQYLNTIQNA